MKRKHRHHLIKAEAELIAAGEEAGSKVARKSIAEMVANIREMREDMADPVSDWRYQYDEYVESMRKRGEEPKTPPGIN